MGLLRSFPLFPQLKPQGQSLARSGQGYFKSNRRSLFSNANPDNSMSACETPGCWKWQRTLHSHPLGGLCLTQEANHELLFKSPRGISCLYLFYTKLPQLLDMASYRGQMEVNKPNIVIIIFQCILKCGGGITWDFPQRHGSSSINHMARMALLLIK